MSTKSIVGSRVWRKEGPDKLCGLSKYIDDYPLENCLHAVTKRSSIASGRIRSIRFERSFDWGGAVVAGAEDIPGVNEVLLIQTDQPLLASKRIRHQQEPILVVGHASRQMAYEALNHIRIEYEEEAPVLNIDEALSIKKAIHGNDNLLAELKIERGQLESGFAAADQIIEGEAELPYQEQAYIENNGVAAWEDQDGTLVIMGSLQCPYYVHKAMLPIFGRAADGVRIIQTTTGGGFGGKEEYPNMIAGHAALLAIKSGHPVKMIYDRHEDMLATTKRHPARIRTRTGVKNDGTLMAMDIDVVMDGGAYATLSPVVLSRGILHATGAYDCPNVRIRGRAVATNTPPNGAFRGFGAPQTLFAAELQMDRIAAALRIDPLSLRRKNLFREGSVTATGQELAGSVGATAVLEDTAQRCNYTKIRKDNERWNRGRSNPTWRGAGLSVVFHGAGFTGSGEVYLASRAGVALTEGGTLRIDAASTEIGQGTSTMLAQIVAETMGIPYDFVEVATPDTGSVPDSGPTVASRTCMVVGAILKRATQKLRHRIEGLGFASPFTRADLADAAQRLEETQESAVVETYEKPEDVSWNEETYEGEAYAAYSYAAMVVELEVDKLTYEVRLSRVTTSQDVGKAIQPTLVKGQILGGTVQGLGYALLENVLYAAGRMQNASLTNYIIPTSLDTPPIDVHIVEQPYGRGPFGAKGVGELPMDVPAPAVAAAIQQATGELFSTLPITPERIAERLKP